MPVVAPSGLLLDYDAAVHVLLGQVFQVAVAVFDPVDLTLWSPQPNLHDLP